MAALETMESPMQLLVAIVQSEDADNLLKKLNAAGYRATRINTVGGFLAQGNVTVLIGLQDEQVDEVIGFIQKTCRTRRSYINPTPLGTEPIHLARARQCPRGVDRRHRFTFPVKRFVRTMGPGVPPTAYEAPRAAEPTPGATNMNLVLAFIQNEDVDQVTRALLDAEHRVTRINTAGAFLRRGNVTLLIGVEEAKVDEVVGLIQSNAPPRSEASPASAGMPSHGATIFVLEASRTVRV
jgi:uncharacterized protein YaaQ